MFLESLLEKVQLFAKAQKILPLFLLCIGLISSGYGVSSLYSAQQRHSVASQVVECPSAPADEEESQVVAVIGAVETPGLYTVSPGTRVGQVLELAGGVSPKADTLLTQKTTNLARVLQDGESVFIPSTDEREVAAFCTAITGNSGVGSDTTVTSNTTGSVVSVNNATQSQLEALTGIGEKTAKAIIAARPYTVISELVDKKVISSSLFETLKTEISL